MTEDFSYLATIPVQDWLRRICKRQELILPSGKKQPFFHEFSLKFRGQEGLWSSRGVVSLGRSMQVGAELARVTIEFDIYYDGEGAFQSLNGLELLVEYGFIDKSKEFRNDYELTEVPAKLTSDLLGFRISSLCLSQLQKAYRELLDEIQYSVEHDDLHTDTSDLDLSYQA
jgi:hypothetical protein